MNTTLKPVLSQSGVPQASNQTSPAKANVATPNHAVALPQGALNSVNHSANNLVGQNLSHQLATTPPALPHAAPSMAPVSANMAQMAANMSHHGNLSHVTQNAVAVTNNAVSPTKPASASSPLSLVQDKVTNPAQPLALTRSLEKKEPDSTGQSNGCIESPTTVTNVPTPLKPENPEVQVDKQDIAKTSPSTPKPPESTQPKPESSNTVTQPDSPVQPKVATANDSIKPTKPSELKATPAADVAPIADDKPVLESANDNQNSDKPVPQESVTTPSSVEEKKEEEIEKPTPAEDKKEEEEVKTESDSQDSTKEENEVKSEKPEVSERVTKTATKAEVKSTPKPTLKLATVTPPLRKRRHLSDKIDGATPPKKSTEAETPNRTKRNRTQVQLYQASASDISALTPGPSSATKPKDQSSKKSKDKLRLFVSREYVAVRNEENGYYVCQLLQNVYRSSGLIRVRWLSQVSTSAAGDIYKPDYCDEIDTGCLMTTLDLRRAGGGYLLRAEDRSRVMSILQRALRAAETGDTRVHVSEGHPDGLDVTLVTDESQLERKSRKRTSSKASPKKSDMSKESEEEATPAKKSRSRSSKGKTKTPKKGGRKSAGSTPSGASTSKTATTVTDTPKTKSNKNKKSNNKKETPASTPSKGRRSTRETKSTPTSPEPSTSTGKGTRSAKKPK